MSIIISGGGIIGSILALMLSKLTQGKVEISLIEQFPPFYENDHRKSNAPRIIVLSRGAYFKLAQIGLESVLLKYSNVISRIEISELNRFNKIFINAQDHQLSELGYIIALQEIKNQIFNLLKKQKIVSMYYPATINQIKNKKDYSVVLLNNSKQLVAKLIVIADGSYSKLATNCGIQWFRSYYQQIAVTTEVVTEIPHFGCAFERFTKFGSLALLPIYNNLSFLIWCVSSYKKTEISKWDKNKFSQEFQNAFGWRLGKILDVGTRCFYDLWLIYAKNHIAHRLALVGNAAQNLHPIAGQGLNLGIRDIVTLSKIIYQALQNDIDIGDRCILNLYQKNRRSDQHQILTITNSLVWLFNTHYLPLVIIRNFGLFCVGQSIFLRSILVNSMLFWKSE